MLFLPSLFQCLVLKQYLITTFNSDFQDFVSQAWAAYANISEFLLNIKTAFVFQIYYTSTAETSSRRRREAGTLYLDVSKTSQATVKGLKKGTKYEFEVAAKNLKGVSDNRSDKLPVDTKKGGKWRMKMWM